MKHVLSLLASAKDPRFARSYQLNLETLEKRLPPGDVIWGLVAPLVLGPQRSPWAPAIALGDRLSSLKREPLAVLAESQAEPPPAASTGRAPREAAAPSRTEHSDQGAADLHAGTRSFFVDMWAGDSLNDPLASLTPWVAFPRRNALPDLDMLRQAVSSALGGEQPAFTPSGGGRGESLPDRNTGAGGVVDNPDGPTLGRRGLLSAVGGLADWRPDLPAGPGTTANGPDGPATIGFMGCSVTMNGVQGYHTVGGSRFWTVPGTTFGGGTVSRWAADLSDQSRYWSSFQGKLDAHPETGAIWWQFCTTPGSAATDNLDNALLVLGEIQRRAPGVTVYVSALAEYSGHVCSLAGRDGPARMQELAGQLVEGGYAEAGPVVGPLTRDQTRDGCHLNAAGMVLVGGQLLEFFDGGGGSPTSDPTRNYWGGNGLNMAWGETARHSQARPEQFATILSTHDLIHGASHGLGSGRGTRVADHMNENYDTLAQPWKEQLRTLATALIEAQAGTAHRVFWQFGNELNAAVFSQNFRSWVAQDPGNRPYPYPWSTSFAFDPEGQNDRGFIGYYVEYFLAPGVEVLQEVNQSAQPEDQIRIMLGSLANAFDNRARNTWLPALLNYEIQGLAAPGLAGKRVYEIVEVLSIHYLMANATWRAIDGLFDSWVIGGATPPPPTTIAGLYSTEEIGIAAATRGDGASTAVRIFSHYTTWWDERGLSSDQGRATFYGWRDGPPDTRADLMMTNLDDFVGRDTLRRQLDILTSDAGPARAELYAFETQDDQKRVLTLFPQNPAGGTLLVSSLTMQAAGWDPRFSDVQATVRVYDRTATPPYQTLTATVTEDLDLQTFTLSFPPQHLNDSREVGALVVEVTRL